MKNTQKLAVSGLLTALSTVIVILSNIIPIGMFTFPAVAGIIIYILSIAAGQKYAWMSFIVTSLISFALCTEKEAAVCFILFLGFYPMVKEHIEKLRIRVIAYILKLLLFNACGVAIYFILIFVFSVPADTFEFFDINLPAVLLAILNAVFLIYDYALTVFNRVYRKKIYNFITKLIKKK